LKTDTSPFASRLAAVACLFGALAASGCASMNPKDPLEGFNRGVFAFNEVADKAIIKPVAQGYDKAVPLPGKVVVSNLFSNLTEPLVALNNLLQGKPGQAFSDVGRFLINSTVGILGAFDIATEMGIDRHEEDFGQTFGRWGVGEGAYVVWPIIGPRTLRDTVGFLADGYVDPVWNLGDVPVRNSLAGLRFVNQRAQLLPLDKTLEEAATDKYAYVRDAYLQRRRSLIRDGKPQRESDEGASLELPVRSMVVPGVNGDQGSAVAATSER
jgi:phospholipid-binding lipoprotein MlaA